MKKKLLTKAIVLLITSVFSLTYLFLIPLTRIQLTYAQDINVPAPSQAPRTQKTTSKLYIPTGASSTILKESNGETSLLIQDHLTSTRVIETSKGTQSQEYFPYGMANGGANTITDKQFTSHRSLADTGVYHAGARFYNPQLGLFVSADKVQGPNRYLYAMANPTTYTDPSGKIIPIIIAAIIIGGAAFGAGFGAGYEQGSQQAQYGSVKEPVAVIAAGITGGAVGAGAGYMGAIAVPAAIGAISTGVGATSALGLVGGAQIGVGACLSNPNCMNAFESGAQMASGADLPPGYSSSLYSSGDELVDQAGLGLAKNMNRIWVPEISAPAGGLDPRYFTEAGEATDALSSIRTKLLSQIGNHVDPSEVTGVYVVGSNRSGDITGNSDIDILIYTRNTYFDRASEETYSPRAIRLQRAMNPQIKSDEDWLNFTLQYKGLPSTVVKRDLIDMFVSSAVGGGRKGGSDVFDLLNNRWGNVIRPTERTLILPSHTSK